MPTRASQFVTAAVVLITAAPALAQQSAADEKGAAASAEATDPLGVMTYNLRYASDRPPNAWPQRLPVAVAMLRELAPDIVGMQEALYRQVKDLERELPEFGWIGLGRDGGSRGEFMAVFYRRERLEPLEFDHYWLSDTPEVVGSTTWGNSNRRMVTWIRFRDLRNKRELYFVNTHFDHEIEEARQKSADLVRSRLERFDAKLPVILVGDFNAAAEKSVAYETLVTSGPLRDSWKQAAKHGPEIGTFHNYRGPREGGARIDWILSRGPVECLETEVVTFSQNSQFPSDHFPVFARLALGE
jgi:endonuclease/exonuclease/phosphatase family metal-dependent hydrolase